MNFAFPRPTVVAAFVLAAILAGGAAAEPGPAEASVTPDPEPDWATRPGEVGAICGLPDLIGQAIGRISGERRGCGIANPVRVARVGGVKLSRPTTMDCPTAIALRYWVEVGLKPVLSEFDWEPRRLEVVGGYICRTINNSPDGDISEHGRGRAIDITGIGLEGGYTVTVAEGWRRRLEGQVLRRLHRAACGPFKTVLGPDADRFHQRHFHLDTKPRATPHCR